MWVCGVDFVVVIWFEVLVVILWVKVDGYYFVILLNELDFFYGKDFCVKLLFLVDFDLIVDVIYIGILKFDMWVFDFVIDGFGLFVLDCVFVDD